MTVRPLARSLNLLKTLLKDGGADRTAFREGMAGLIAHAATTRDIDELRSLCVASMQELARDDAGVDIAPGDFGKRRALDIKGPGEVAKAERAGRSFSLLVIDIERFDDVSDMYGNAVGNAVIEAVAKAIAQSLRQKDVLCRYGDGELVVIAPAMTGPTDPLAERFAPRGREGFDPDGDGGRPERPDFYRRGKVVDGGHDSERVRESEGSAFNQSNLLTYRSCACKPVKAGGMRQDFIHRREPIAARGCWDGGFTKGKPNETSSHRLVLRPHSRRRRMLQLHGSAEHDAAAGAHA